MTSHELHSKLHSAVRAADVRISNTTSSANACDDDSQVRNASLVERSVFKPYPLFCNGARGRWSCISRGGALLAGAVLIGDAASLQSSQPSLPSSSPSCQQHGHEVAAPSFPPHAIISSLLSTTVLVHLIDQICSHFSVGPSNQLHSYLPATAPKSSSAPLTRSIHIPVSHSRARGI